MAKKLSPNNNKQANGMEPFGTHGPGTSRPLSEHPSYTNKDPNVVEYRPKGQLQTIIIPPAKPTNKKK